MASHTRPLPSLATRTLALAGAGLLFALPSAAQVVGEERIDRSSTGLSGLDDMDLFGESSAALGDLDGDGVPDVAVGAPLDDGGGPDRGAVWILFLNADGSVKSTAKINATQGGFAGPLSDLDQFGSSVAALGDLDGDGVVDLAVGAPKDDDGPVNAGAVWILLLNANGTVKASQKISSLAGGFGGSLESLDNFGSAVAAAGDLDGNGRQELAVGAELSDDGGQDTGSVWVLFLDAGGMVLDEREISSQGNGFTVTLDPLDRFGSAVASIGDLNGDFVCDLAVGADADDDNGNNRGAVYVLFMNSDGSVAGNAKISSSAGGFAGPLGDGDRFGSSLAAIGDLEGDGFPELAVGSPFADQGGTDRGEVWLLSLDNGGEVRFQRRIGQGLAGFAGALGNGDSFGSSVGSLGDLDGDGAPDLVVGAFRDDNVSGLDVGAAWVLNLGNLPSFAPLVGMGTNPNCLLPLGAPILGNQWELAVTTFLTPGAVSSFIASFDGALVPGLVLNAGELLVDPTSNPLFLLNKVSNPVVDVYQLMIVNDVALLGRTLYAQGGVFATGGVTLSNAFQYTPGL